MVSIKNDVFNLFDSMYYTCNDVHIHIYTALSSLISYFSFQDARAMANKVPAFKDALMESVHPVLMILEGRFGRLKIKGEPIQIHKPATDDEVSNFFNILHIIDPVLDANKMTHADLKKSSRLTDWIDRHCRSRQYMFQVC